MYKASVYDNIFNCSCPSTKAKDQNNEIYIVNTPTLETVVRPKPSLPRNTTNLDNELDNDLPTFRDIYRGCLDEDTENLNSVNRSKYIFSSTPYAREIIRANRRFTVSDERELYQCLLNEASAIANHVDSSISQCTPLNDITITIDENPFDVCPTLVPSQHKLSPVVSAKDENKLIDSVGCGHFTATDSHEPAITSVADCLQLFNETPYLSDKWLNDLNKKSTNRAKECELLNAKIAFWEKQRILAEKQRISDLEQRLACLLHIPVVTDPYLVPQPIPFELPYKTEKKPVSLPTLTEAQWANTESRLRQVAPGDVLIQKFRLSVTQRDLVTLFDSNWLSDMVINFYLQLLYYRSQQQSNVARKLPKVAVLSTFFYAKLSSPAHVGGGYPGVRRWTRQSKLFEQDIILVPIHNRGMHWCLACVDFDRKSITYYDSMGSANDQVLHHLCDYLNNESMDKLGKPLSDMDQWRLINTEDTVPQQFNGSDCGVFLCTFGEFLSRGAAFTFTQDDMPEIRKRMIYEIINAELLTTNFKCTD